MVGEIDYISLLKCARCLKQRIDDLVNKNPEQISTKMLIFNFGCCVLMYIWLSGAWEVKCTRKEIDKMLIKYFIRTEFIKSSNNHSQTNPKYNNNAENSTKFKVKYILIWLIGFYSNEVIIVRNTNRQMNIYTSCRVSVLKMMIFWRIIVPNKIWTNIKNLEIMLPRMKKIPSEYFSNDPSLIFRVILNLKKIKSVPT